MPSRPSGGIANRPNIGQPGGIANRPGGIGQPGGINRPGDIGSNVNRDLNRDINRDVNRNANRDINHDNDWDWDDHYDGCCYNGWGLGAAAITGAAIGAAAVGSTYYALPPDCVVTVVNGITYNNCGGTWYEPQFNGTSTTYIVVDPPQ